MKQPAEQPRTSIRVGVLEVSGFGGLAHYTFNLCQALSGIGFPLRLLTSADHELAHLPRGFELDLLLSGSQSYLRQWITILRFSLKHRLDLLHIQSLITARKDFAWLTLMRALPMKIVYTAHDLLPHDEPERNAFGMRFALRRIYRSADFVIAHTTEDRRMLVGEFGCPPDCVQSIPHGDYDFMRTLSGEGTHNLREDLNIGSEERLFLFFGALRPYKGIHKLLEAYATVNASPPSRLLIIGRPVDRDYVGKLEKLISDLGIRNRVILIGRYVPVNEIGDIVRAADVVVLPYEHIYDSGVLRLAFSFSRPVIATRVGAFKELVIDGENGVLVGYEASSIAEGLGTMLCCDRSRLRAMGEYSARRFGPELSWERVAADTAAVYRSLVATHA